MTSSAYHFLGGVHREMASRVFRRGTSASDHSLRVQLLQGPYVYLAALQGGNPFRGCARRRKRGDRGNPRRHSRASDRPLVEPRLKPGGSVDDEMDSLALDEIHHVRAE